ncbi:hypothetical protein CROQUDRAFT_97549 [Cronartium quercuum f. sp. fusiforme G11]|uniref:Aminomethyltransferase folate-binding domain-containing protein n=1 Tax=Cronartium quercuum f. sp. fusiforme G11 TaxID=708437 RepID=A0A9P6NAJ9_9BASI|nr:hypothetical protein CROQUDRAFT_97549 [Cronartium quercuum f. sp. fusiforme G11]
MGRSRFRLHRSLQRNRAFHSSPSHPEWVKTQLTDRALISISGQDSTGFLQGLTTNHISYSQLTNIPTPPVTYTAFLSPKGRLLFDCFLYPDPTRSEVSDQPAFLLNHDSSQNVFVRKWLSRFVLRSHVKLEFRKDTQLWAIWNNFLTRSTTDELSQPISESLGQCSLAWTDGRGNGRLGYRMVVPSHTPHPIIESLPLEHYPVQSYALHQLLNASLAPTLSPTYPVTLPFEANLDHHRAIDFRKGCYVGQELTARTYHTGVIRKRLVPISISTGSTPGSLSGIPDLIPKSIMLERLSDELVDELELFLSFDHPLSSQTASTTKKKKPVDKLVGPVLRTTEAVYGLGLLRIDHLAFSSSHWPLLVTQPLEGQRSSTSPTEEVNGDKRLEGAGRSG